MVISRPRLLITCFLLICAFVNCSRFEALTTQVKNESAASVEVGTTPSPENPTPSPSPESVPVAPPSDGGATTPVYSGSFQSLHQYPVRYIKSSALDASNNLTFVYTDPALGFKNQYPPSGTPGCSMGYPEYRSECQSVSGGFGFTVSNGYSQIHEMKVFVPAGTTFFGLAGYLPQPARYAVAVRMGQLPERTTPLSTTEYEAAKAAQHKDKDFGRLMQGEERIIVHDGGGNISLSGVARLSQNPLSKGVWIYVRVISEDTAPSYEGYSTSSIYQLGAIYEVDREIYRREFLKVAFSASGDPQ